MLRQYLLILWCHFNRSDKGRPRAYWGPDRFQWFYFVTCWHNINIVSTKIRNIHCFWGFLTWLRKVDVQMIAANSHTCVVCFQIESYIDSLNLLRILLSFIVHFACRVNRKFENIKKSVNLFQIIKDENIFAWSTSVWLFTIKEYTKSFLITILTTDHCPKS